MWVVIVTSGECFGRKMDVSQWEEREIVRGRLLAIVRREGWVVMGREREKRKEKEKGKEKGS